jgi:catechol 2,3-dioxygenase-like lactoylglutathione lyase family enzyme
MKLNHLNLAVTDVAQTRKLFETYFGFTGLKEVGNDKFAVLFDDGFVLNLMRGAQVSYPDTFHIGFIQESEERERDQSALKRGRIRCESAGKIAWRLDILFSCPWRNYYRSPAPT